MDDVYYEVKIGFRTYRNINAWEAIKFADYWEVARPAAALHAIKQRDAKKEHRPARVVRMAYC